MEVLGVVEAISTTTPNHYLLVHWRVGLVTFNLCGLIFRIFENTVIWIRWRLLLNLKLWNFYCPIILRLVCIYQAPKLANPLLKLWSLLANRWPGICINWMLLNIIPIQTWFPSLSSHSLDMTFALLLVNLTREDDGSLGLHHHMRPILH